MGASITNIDAINITGFNPITGLPTKFGSTIVPLKNDIRKGIRVIDEQNAINRYH